MDGVVDTSVRGAGFTLERILSKVVVRELFAEKNITEIAEKWNPFNSPHFNLKPTVLRVVVGNAYSESSREVSFLARMYIHIVDDL